MALKHKVNTMFKNWGSKRSENSDVKDLEAAIQAEKDSINLKIADIGEYYWNLYATKAFVPDREAKEMFISIRDSNKRIEELKKEIEETRKTGSEERDHNNQELKELEEREAIEAEERKKQKAQAELERLQKEAAEREAHKNEGKN